LQYQTILFDLDGTLTDSFEGITKSAQYALSSFGIQVDDLHELTKFIGPSLYDSFTQFYNMDHDTANAAVEKYRERFRSIGIFENKLYEGIPDMLCSLQNAGATLCIASSKPEVFVKRILDYFDIAKYFSFVCGSLLDGTRSTKEDVIQYVLEHQNNPDLSRVIMVGDRLHDAKGAAFHHIPFCGALYGFGSREELSAYPYVYLAESVNSLQDFLLHG
jgi:phosphoglycolate phosphatase